MYKISSTILFALLCMIVTSCDSSTSDNNAVPETLRIGANLEISGSYSYAGESSENAINLFVEELNKSGGIQIGDENYSVQTDINDNRSTTDGAEDVANVLIDGEDVHIIIGPNVSGLAIPAGEIANDLETLMISPWSSNPLTTENRSWVYRSSFVDTDQSPILVNFATDHLNATEACILFDNEPNAFPSGFASTFKSDWEERHGNGSVSAYESYEPGDEDVSTQLATVANTNCDFLLIPGYPHEIPAIVSQVHDAGITVPVMGPDSWVDGDLLEECGADCEGYYFSKHFVASGTTGDAQTFVDRYTEEYGTQPGDVAALTWDAMLLAEQAIKNCGRITGDLAADRTCVRNGMQAISNLEGVTGTYSFGDRNNPEKCIPVVQIQNSDLVFVETICL